MLLVPEYTFAKKLDHLLPPISGDQPLPANRFIKLAELINPAVVNISTTQLPPQHRRRENRYRNQDPSL